MSDRSSATVTIEEVPKIGAGLVLAVAAAIVCPFDALLSGMIHAGLGVEAICAALGLSRGTLDYNLVRLDLPTPADKPRRRGGRRAWIDAELRCAVYWRCLGVHPETIGLAYDRTPNAVRSKMRRLGVPTPHRSRLHKVDPAILDRTPPDFGFPDPPCEHSPVAKAAPEDVRSPALAIVPPSSDPGPAFDGTIRNIKGAGKSRNAVVPGQRDLTLPSSVPKSKPKPEKPVAVCKPGHDGEKPLVSGPADLIHRYRVTGKVARQDANKDYLIWLTLLYRGGMHYKAIGAYLGRSASAVQAILYRTQVPRATDRGSFGWTCDLECAVAELEQWEFELYRCTSSPDLPESERPLFWRRKGDKGNRRRRCARLKNKEVDDYAKYKGGQSVEIMTRARLEAQRRIESTDPTVRNGARLHVSMQGSLPIQQGAANEQFPLRGHAPTVRPGLPGDARNQMSWALPRDGSAARPVARP